MQIVSHPMAQASIPKSMGIDKSGTQTLPLSTWTQVTSWVVRSGFPDTDLNGDGIRSSGSAAFNISGQVAFGYISGVRQLRLKVNGTVIATGVAWTDNQSGPVTITLNGYTLNNTDVLTLEATASSSFSSSNVISSGNTTFLTATLA